MQSNFWDISESWILKNFGTSVRDFMKPSWKGDKTIRPKISMRTRNFTMYTRYKIMTGIDKQLFLPLNQLKEPSFLLLYKANLLVNPLFTYISVYLCTFWGRYLQFCEKPEFLFKKMEAQSVNSMIYPVLITSSATSLFHASVRFLSIFIFS